MLTKEKILVGNSKILAYSGEKPRVQNIIFDKLLAKCKYCHDILFDSSGQPYAQKIYHITYIMNLLLLMYALYIIMNSYEL